MSSPSTTPNATDLNPAQLSDADAARLKGLRRMKSIALGLLIALSIIFLFAFAYQDRYPWLQWVRAGAEGGMVGALADWFAVTALFRHPMGLKIPHTAIIPRRKDQIGASLGGFIEENFLREDVVRGKMAGLDVAGRVGGWLTRPGENGQTGADRVTEEGAVVIRAGLGLLKDDDVAAVLESMARRHFIDPPWGPPLGKVAEEVFRDGHHRPVVSVLVDRAEFWLSSNRDVVVELVTERSPSWVPAMLDNVVGERVHAELLKFVRAVQSDPDHRVRRSIDEYLLQLADDMQNDPATRDKVDAIKESILDDPRVRGFAARTWESAKAALLEAVSDPNSEFSRRFTRLVTEFGERLLTDRDMADRVNDWVTNAAVGALQRYGHDVASVIEETVERWDAQETSRKIELQVGKDLQYIRINGTVIGSLAGLTIFTIAHLIFG